MKIKLNKEKEVREMWWIVSLFAVVTLTLLVSLIKWWLGPLLVVLVVILLISLIKRIGPAEMAVLLIRDKPEKFVGSGWRLIFWFLGHSLIKFPKTQLMLEYGVEKSVTRADWYIHSVQEWERAEEIVKSLEREAKELPKIKNWANLSKEEKSLDLEEKKKKLEGAKKRAEETKKKYEEDMKNQKGEFCESVELEKVVFAVYFRYPRTDSLKITLEVLGGPLTSEALQKHYRDYAVGYLREVIGEMTWRGVIENREKIVREMKNRFITPGSPFMVAGFDEKDLYVAITTVEIPSRLANLLSLPQEKALEAKAATAEGETIAEETVGSFIAMICRQTGMTRKDVEAKLKDKPREFVQKYKEIWDKNWDVVHRQMGIKGGGYLDIRTANSIQDLVALWQRMPMRRRPSEEEDSETKTKKEKGEKGGKNPSWPALDEERRKSEEKLAKNKK